jgi:hypothetical protein
MSYLYLTAEVLAIVCSVTALLDMGMNGGRYAEWAPWGFSIAVACGAVLLFLQ